MTEIAVSPARAEFEQRIAELVEVIGERSPGEALADHLSANVPPGSDLFEALDRLCTTGIEEGWLANREGGGVRFGRVLRNDHPATGGHSVDVVLMDSVVGPYHAHPLGEIDLVLPRTDGAQFDDHSRGWVSYPPESAHAPTVSGGAAVVVYLLPGGAIDFTAAEERS